MNEFDQSMIMQAVARFGTPLYLYDGAGLRQRYREMKQFVHHKLEIFYSMKANPLLGICQIYQQAGAGIEVCSHAELLIALRAGYSAKKIIFVGPGKSNIEISACIKAGIKAIICESISELALINKLAEEADGTCSVLLRLNPAFRLKEAPLKMSGQSTQFGIDMQTLQTLDWQCYKNINIQGVHIYNGTRVLSAEALIKNTEYILNLCRQLKQKYSFTIDCIDIGGGFGIPYFAGEHALDVQYAMNGINRALDSYLNEFPETMFILECGRYLLGEFGCLLAKVLYQKISHQQRYLIIDAGMNCHMAATGLNSFVRRNFPIAVVDATDKTQKYTYQIAGPLCTPGDVLAIDIELPEVNEGDIMIFKQAGAYGATASLGRFLSHGFPAEAIYENEQLHLLKRREDIDDLLATNYDYLE